MNNIAKKPKISSSNSLILIFHICLISLLTITGFSKIVIDEGVHVTEIDVILSCWVGNLVLLWCLWTWKKTRGELFSPYILFLISYFVFSFGQPFLRSIGFSYEDYDLYKAYTNLEMYSAQLYTILGLAFLQLGALLTKNNKQISVDGIEKLHDKQLIKAIKIVAISLVLISGYQYLYHYVNVAVVSLSYGYGALYERPDDNLGLLSSLRLFFIPGTFLLLAVYKDNRIIRSIIFIILVSSAILGFISGGRGMPTALILSLAWLWHVQIKRVRGIRVIALVLGGLLLLSTFSAIGDFRNAEDKSLTGFISMYTNEDNPVFSAIGSMGVSMLPLIESMNLLPDYYSFKLGATYIASVIMLIPSFLRFGVDGYLISENLISLPEWLQSALGMSYGPGFSLIAEAFYNFGWFGIPVMAVYGFVITSFINVTSKNHDMRILQRCFSATILYHLLTMVRGSSTLLFKNELYFAIVPMIIIILLYNSLKDKKGM